MNKFEKALAWAVYLLIALLPLQTRWLLKGGIINGGYSEYSTISLYATDVLAFMIFASYAGFLFLAANKESRAVAMRIKSIWIAIGMLELAVFLSIFSAEEKLPALFGYGRFLLFVGLFWVMSRIRLSKIKSVVSLVVGALFASGLGVWQFLTQSSFACKWLGLAEHRAETLGTSVVEVVRVGFLPERWLRAYGSLDHPNILGGFLSITIIAIFVLLVVYRDKLADWMSLVFKVGFLFAVMALFFTFSRSAWIIALLAMFLTVGYIFVIEEKQKLSRAAELFAMAGVVVAVLFYAYGGIVRSRTTLDNRLEQKSASERILYLSQAKSIIKKHWLLGVGLNNYPLAVARELREQKGSQDSWNYQPVHNVFLLVLAETGILGLLAFISFLLLLLAHKLRNIKENLNILDIGLLLGMIGLMLFDHWWWSLHFGILFFWLLLGLINTSHSSEV